MSSRIVLDTNAYSELSRGNTEILDVLSQAERTYIPVTVLGELFAGFRGGNHLGVLAVQSLGLARRGLRVLLLPLRLRLLAE